MWLLQGNPPPSHGMLNAFRKHLLREVIEKLFYDAALVCFGYNVNKLHHKIQQGRCGKSLHPLQEKAS
jgi:hypothetical protein